MTPLKRPNLETLRKGPALSETTVSALIRLAGLDHAAETRVQPRQSPRRRRQQALRADVLWFGLAFLLFTLSFNVVVDWKLPKLYDLEYGTRLELLENLLEEEPERPLLAVVGSSRLGMGFMPELLPDLPTADGRLALPFNFAHLTAGPVMNLLDVDRLLRQDIRPRWLVLEVIPAGLANELPSCPSSMAAAADLPLLDRYVSPQRLFGIYLRSRLNPFYKHRQGMVRQFGPAWASAKFPNDQVTLYPLGGDDGWMRPKEMSAEEVRRRTDEAKAYFFPRLQGFHIDASCDQALRETLDRCRQEKTQVLLLLTPESSEFRGWYGSHAEALLQSYLAHLHKTYRTPIVDARAWLDDAVFTDGHHVQEVGAKLFTQRFAEEVLRPLASNRLAP